MLSDHLVPVAFSGIQHQPQSKIWTIRGNKMQHAKVMLKIFGNPLANCCETVKLAARKP